LEDGRLTLTVLTGSRRTKVRILMPGTVQPLSFVGAHLQVEGVSAAVVDSRGKHTGVQIFVASLQQIQLLEGSTLTNNPFNSTSEPSASAKKPPGELVHLSGVVVEQRPDRMLVIDHGARRVVARLTDNSQFAPGDSVDLLGFVTAEAAFQLEDTIVHLVAPRTPLEESQITGALRTIRELKSLSVETAANGLPVDIQGTVTYMDPSASLLFVQDGTAGAYVDIHHGSAEVVAGDTVHVKGLSGPGDYAPTITRPVITRLGRGPMPKPLTLSPQTSAWGSSDASWVEIVGVVHSVAQLNSLHSFKLAVAGNKFDVQLPRSADIATLREGLYDAQVRIEGVCGAVFNERRQLVGLKFFVPSAADIHILEPAPAVASVGVRSIVSLLRFDPANLSSHRTTVRGVVTLRDNDRGFYAQDATAGIYVLAERRSPVRIGQYVEASGFPVAGPDGPYLEDATVNGIDGAPHLMPARVTADDLTTGLYDSQLVIVQGRLFKRLDGLDDNTLLLQVGELVLRARLQGQRISPHVSQDSVVEVVGVLQSEGRDGRSDLKMALPSPAAVRVISAAPWWTWENVAQSLAALLIVILVALLWVSIKVYQVRSYQAAYDCLTGLPNRRASLEYLERQLPRSIRERSPLAVVLADVDHFKSINDTYGHQVGDRVLRKIADIFKVALRPEDTVGRYGGEEFLLVLRDCDALAALEIAERTRLRLMEEGFDSPSVATPPFQVTCSFGIAVVTTEPLNIDQVLASADRALYAAKNSGRNRVVVANLASGAPTQHSLVTIA
jgi:diguanylate cyclase (GGDEF)-like protein